MAVLVVATIFVAISVTTKCDEVHVAEMKVHPGKIVLHNWVHLEHDYVDRFKFICNNSDAFECVSTRLFRSADLSLDDWTDLRSKLNKSLTPNDVKELICWWPDALPDFNDMFRARYANIISNSFFHRNYSVWDVDRIYSVYTDVILGVRDQLVPYFKEGGRFGEWVESDANALNFFAVMYAVQDARTCLEKVSDLRW